MALQHTPVLYWVQRAAHLIQIVMSTKCMAQGLLPRLSMGSLATDLSGCRTGPKGIQVAGWASSFPECRLTDIAFGVYE